MRVTVVEGYGGFYSVSDEGVVFGKGGKPLSPSNYMGYMRVVLRAAGQGPKTVGVHRLVAAAFVENPDKLNTVNHKDGNPSNNHYTNLEWCTHKDNICHARDVLGRTLGKPHPGSTNVQAKITEADVVEMRKLKEKGLSYRQLATTYGICKDNVRDIIKRKAWKHVP